MPEDSASKRRKVMKPSKKVMITGANGYLASHIVKDLLEKGHVVHACVRDKMKNVEHLKGLPESSERLHLFSTGDLTAAKEKKSFDAPMKGCDAVIHAATPITPKFGADHDGEKDIFEPAMLSTQELLDCIERHNDTVKCLVLTSSMSAVAPQPEPAVKDESHWSDEKKQKARGNWYGCTKTSQEQLVNKWVEKSKESKGIAEDFVYVTICPTMVIGPSLSYSSKLGPGEEVSGTMGTFHRWLTGGKSKAPNDSMSFIHVEDCARMHTCVLNDSDSNAAGRYMSLIESLHWNDILSLLKELYPKLPAFETYDEEDKVTPTQFNLERMNSLKVPVRSTKETLMDSIKFLEQIGALE